jgi:hypothetical protein
MTTTRKEVQSRIQDRGFTNPEQLLALNDYEFEQWCGKTAKGTISDAEKEWLETNLPLVERWVDGLEGLVDSADTQIEHAEAEIDAAEDEAEQTGDWTKYEELERFQREWKPKINTFQRKVTRTLRNARRTLRSLEREGGSDRAKELEEAIHQHYQSVTFGDDDEAEDADFKLWAVVGAQDLT